MCHHIEAHIFYNYVVAHFEEGQQFGIFVTFLYILRYIS